MLVLAGATTACFARPTGVARPPPPELLRAAARAPLRARRSQDEVGFRTFESLATSMSNLLAAARILRRARSLAASLSNSVWLKRAIALRTWD